jgi:hypothetical protein
MPLNDADEETKIIDAIYRGACDPAELRRAIEGLAGYFGSGGKLRAQTQMYCPISPASSSSRIRQ